MADLESMLSIALATLDGEGRLIEANRGFLRLLHGGGAETGQDWLGRPAGQFFIQPSFAVLANTPAGIGGEVYRGLMTIGDYEARQTTLRGRVCREGDRIQVLAERDIEEMERIGEGFRALNDYYGQAQFELAQLNLELRHLKAELEQRVEERTRDLADALLRAEAANRAKSAFLNAVSHELRTPLHQIVNLAGILKSQETDPQRRQWIEYLTSSGYRLSELIDDILTMSSLAADTCEIEQVEFDVLHFMTRIEEEVRARFATKGLVLLQEVDSRLPFTLRGDPERLGKILLHLLDNSIKFSAAGVVTMRAIRVQANAGLEMVRFEVEDEGIGIEKNKQATIFNAFEQADNSLTRNYEGAGLGLAICKQLAQLMGGQIGVESTPGKGSLFRVDIPLVGNAGNTKAATKPEGVGVCVDGT
ncbi:MAG: ATP-binding protein [Pseudomonadota bacterium]